MCVGFTGFIRLNQNGDGLVGVNIWSYEPNANFSPFVSVDLVQNGVRNKKIFILETLELNLEHVEL